ncbi:MAG: VWA domain-containing protein [Gammaproteobacteria bacterium]|nr:MAG: VWA domain-containing protein [Gammaproteobacteria bacterium]
MNAGLFHFLRPEWLLAIIPLLLFCFWLLNQVSKQSSWQKVVDPVLLQHLLQQDEVKRKRHWPVFLLGLAGTLSIIALAGPTWERLPQPVFRNESALVLILDLSKSMDAQDIKPSRLERARFKVADILKQRDEGQTALIVYAADAFTVTPLTDDIRTITSQLPALTTSLMPAQGSNSQRAIELAANLLKRASQTSGDVLLITDEVQTAAGMESAQWLAKQGYRLSILGVGTKDGAPVPMQGSMLKDSQGNIVIPKLDGASLRRIASVGGGRYATIAVNDSDIQTLALNEVVTTDNTGQRDEQTTDVWREFGPWLLLPVLPLAALVFRRGVLLVMLLTLMPLPKPAQAFEWQDLWKTPDQQAQQLMQQQKPAEAAAQFTDPAWKAGAQYQSGDYNNALKAYQALQGTEARYNEGNTLAKLGRLEDAIKAYDETLKADPNHEDAKYNRQLIEDILKQQQSQQTSQDSKQQSEQSQDQEQGQKQQDEPDDSGQNSESAQDAHTSDSPSNQDPEQQADATESQQDSPEQAEMSQALQDEEHQVQSPSDLNQQYEQEQDAEQTESEQQKNADEAREPVVDDKQRPSEQQIANEQWLRRIPDDPAGLLRRKFKYQYSQRANQYTGEKQW